MCCISASGKSPADRQRVVLKLNAKLGEIHIPHQALLRGGSRLTWRSASGSPKSPGRHDEEKRSRAHLLLDASLVQGSASTLSLCYIILRDLKLDYIRDSHIDLYFTLKELCGELNSGKWHTENEDPLEGETFDGETGVAE